MPDAPITNLYESDEAVLKAIMDLYDVIEWDLDPTFSSGHFYSPHTTIPRPSAVFDIDPQVDGVLQADCSDLSLWYRNESVASAVIDLPFIHAPGKDSIMGQRFSGFKSQHELRQVYASTAAEMSRITSKNGILAWKCQNIVESGKQNWTTMFVALTCMDHGFTLEDEFLLGRRAAIKGHNHSNQQHARKVFSYWMVFKKTGAERPDYLR